MVVIPATELLSQRGKSQLICGNRIYNINSSRFNLNRTVRSIVYRCCTKDCRGSVSKIIPWDPATDEQETLGDPVILEKDYSHIFSCVGDPTRVLIRQGRQLAVHEAIKRGK